MNRLYLKVFALVSALLFIGVAALNIAIDPFGLYGVARHQMDRRPAYVLNRYLFRMSEFERAEAREPFAVIVGDSTSAQLDADAMTAASARRHWFNAAVDGSNLREVAGMARRVVDDGRADFLVIGLPMRRMTSGARDLHAPAEDAIASRWAQAMSFESLRASIRILGENSLGWRGLEDAPGAPRERIFDHSIERSRNEMQRATWPDDILPLYEALEQAAADRGIRVVYFIPPQDDALDALFEGEFPTWPQRHRAFLQTRCVLDMNPAEDADWPRARLKDSVHIDNALRLDFSGDVARRMAALECVGT